MLKKIEKKILINDCINNISLKIYITKRNYIYIKYKNFIIHFLNLYLYKIQNRIIFFKKYLLEVGLIKRQKNEKYI